MTDIITICLGPVSCHIDSVRASFQSGINLSKNESDLRKNRQSISSNSNESSSGKKLSQKNDTSFAVISIDSSIYVNTQSLERTMHNTYYWTDNPVISVYVCDIMETLRSKIESALTSIEAIVLCCDIASGLCSSILSLLSRYIKEYCDHVPLICFNFFSSPCIFGLAAFNCTIGSYYCLEYVNFVAYRDIFSSSWYISPESRSENSTDVHGNIFGVNVEMRDMINATACDIHIFYESLRADKIKILNHVNSKSKIFDIRSSCYRLQMLHEKKAREGKTVTKQEYSPMRTLANSIHSLDLHSDCKSSIDLEICDIVPTSLYYSMKFDTGEQSYSFCRSSFTATDIRVAVEWASPSITWPNPSTLFVEVSSTADVKEGNEIAICVFESPYGKNLLHRVVLMTKAMFNHNAYFHDPSSSSSSNERMIGMEEEQLFDICHGILNFLE